jgi:hypothetical protein
MWHLAKPWTGIEAGTFSTQAEHSAECHSSSTSVQMSAPYVSRQVLARTRRDTAFLILLAATIAGCGCAEGCTVFAFNESGFASNLNNLFTAWPVFDGSGTFFVDNSANNYR